MPRNNDGKVVKIYNWIDEDTNNRTFTGEKLEADTRDLADIAEECLDINGRNNMQNNLNLENNNVINSAEPKRLKDLVPLSYMQGFITKGLECVDNGSEQLTGIIKLKSTLEDLLQLENGMQISFIAPFTLSIDNIKALQGYEKIELDLAGTGLIKAVIRGSYEVDNSYVGGIKDPRGSFIAGNKYTLEYNEQLDGWISKDGNLKGQIINYADNTITPAGYIDIAYSYAGYANMSLYNYLGSYSPKRKSTDASSPDYEVYERNFGEQIGTLPEHEHGESRSISADNTGGTGSDAHDTYTPSSTTGTTSLSPNNYKIGDKVEPLSNIVRVLQKL